MLLRGDVTIHNPCNENLDFFIILIGPCVPGENVEADLTSAKFEDHS